jgi:hypothetical protein
MPRLFSRSFAVTLLALAGLVSARADYVRYLVPVTYDMAITRQGSSTETTRQGVTTETSSPSFEVFTSKDLLKLILGDSVSTEADLKRWALYAEGRSTTFTDPNGLETLQLIALKKKDTDETVSLPEGMTFSLTLSGTRSYSSTGVYGANDAGTNYDETRVRSKRETIAQLAELTQALPARGERSAGTLTTTGYLTHGLVLNKVKIDGETTEEPILRSSVATYRAVGTFNAETDSEDGLVEVLISFGTPQFETVVEETPAPSE